MKLRWKRLVLAGPLCIGVVAGIVWRSDQGQAGVRTQSPVVSRAPAQDGISIAAKRAAVARYSRRFPPAIVRANRGDLPTTFRQAARDYVKRVCGSYDEQNAMVHNLDAALDNAWTEAGEMRGQLETRFSKDRVPLRLTGSTKEWFEEWLGEDSSRRPCETMGLIDLLTIWPEGELQTYLAELAMAPPYGSIRIQVAAVDAMAQTGRGEYLSSLKALVDPASDSRVVWRALRAIAVISDDSTPFVEVVQGSSMDDELQNAFELAVSPLSEGSACEVLRAIVPGRHPYHSVLARTLSRRGFAGIDCVVKTRASEDGVRRVVDTAQERGSQ